MRVNNLPFDAIARLIAAHAQRADRRAARIAGSVVDSNVHKFLVRRPYRVWGRGYARDCGRGTGKCPVRDLLGRSQSPRAAREPYVSCRAANYRRDVEAGVGVAETEVCCSVGYRYDQCLRAGIVRFVHVLDIGVSQIDRAVGFKKGGT